jgi:hypothetical protein
VLARDQIDAIHVALHITLWKGDGIKISVTLDASRKARRVLGNVGCPTHSHQLSSLSTTTMLPVDEIVRIALRETDGDGELTALCLS